MVNSGVIALVEDAPPDVKASRIFERTLGRIPATNEMVEGCFPWSPLRRMLVIGEIEVATETKIAETREELLNMTIGDILQKVAADAE